MNGIVCIQEPSLYQSGYPPYSHATVADFWVDVVAHGIRAVVNLREEKDEGIPMGMIYCHIPLADGLPDLLTRESDLLAARNVVNGLLLYHKTLVHCLGGRGRSGLVNGLVLNLRGATGQQALQNIRAVVPDAIPWPHAEEYLICRLKGWV